MGRKGHRKDKEWDEIQRLKVDNKKLRGQISKLRKVISRLDFEQYHHVKELLESQQKQNKKATKQQQKQEMEARWRCYECEEGTMRLVVIHRVGEPYYFRKCDHCDNKTKMKKMTEEVEGV